MQRINGTGIAVRGGAIALAMAVFVAPRASARQCVGDVNGDGVVQSLDLTELLNDWAGPPSSGIASDVDGSGIVDARDLALLIGAWGPCPLTPLWATVLEAQPDPAVVTDPALRAAIEASGLAWRVRDRASGIEMLLVPPGSFMMGASAGDAMAFPDEFPAHLVTLSHAFYLGRYEVTQSQYEATMEYNPSWNTENLDPEFNPIRPVESVPLDWVGVFLSFTALRLPTEAEWEFACRAGTSTPTYAVGGQQLGDLAWYSPNGGGMTQPTGRKLANALGFHDMLGNVWEWVSDWYASNYYAESPRLDPTGPLRGEFHVIRGGSWFAPEANVRSSFRGAIPGWYVLSDTGFRAARTP